MATKKKPPAPADGERLTVYPDPSLAEGSFVAGVPADGVELSAEEARPLLESGVVTTTKPASPAEG